MHFSRGLFALVVIYGLAVASYFVTRYDRQWMEGDTARITATIETLQAEGTLSAPQGVAYTHGYGYQVVSMALSAATGLDPQVLQTQVYPFLAVLGLALAAFAFFSRVLNDQRLATLATFLLFFQPDLLFVTLRGSHEKLSWPLMLIALTLLHRSLGQPARSLTVHLVLFYLTLFAMIATNVFFASTFLVAMLVSLGVGMLVLTLRRRRWVRPPADLGRLIYISASGGILVYLFMTYLYPLALSNLRLLRTIGDQLSVFLLDFEILGQPYDYIALGWVNAPTYWGLTLFTWLLLSVSLIEWLWRAKRLATRSERFGLREMLDWLLYAGFAIQVLLSVVVDFAGVLGANLQLRLVPVFTIFAVAMLARGLGRWLAWPGQPDWLRGVTWGLTGLLVIWFAGASVLKASNEATLSNKWIFSTPAEAATLHWAEQHLTHVTLWTSFDERLSVVALFYYGDRPASGNTYTGFKFDLTDRYVLYSETEHLRGLRLNLAMPVVVDWNRIYDNGDVQLYHRRPQTPYQH